jgi:hypothetical protein
LSLARAIALCIDAKRAIKEGRSPAVEKQRARRRLLEAKGFGELGETWLVSAPMADSTRAMRRSISERELLPTWRKRLLPEIVPDDLRAHCAAIVERGAPATAIYVRDIVKQIYAFAICMAKRLPIRLTKSVRHRSRILYPGIAPSSPTEIRIMLKQLEHVATLPTIRLGVRLYLLTMVRKRVARCQMGGGRLRKCGLDNPEGENEALKCTQRVPVAPNTRYLHCPQNLRRQLKMRSSVALRRR